MEKQPGSLPSFVTLLGFWAVPWVQLLVVNSDSLELSFSSSVFVLSRLVLLFHVPLPTGTALLLRELGTIPNLRLRSSASRGSVHPSLAGCSHQPPWALWQSWALHTSCLFKFLVAYAVLCCV